MTQNLLDHLALRRFDKGDNLHPAATLRTSQGVHFIHTSDKHGQDPVNPISTQLERQQARLPDGRVRFPQELRQRASRHLIDNIRQISPQLEISLCLEEPAMFDSLLPTDL
ncbi:MAG: hypothetical protein ABSG67_11115 [Thermoguttaceae bacterium]